MPVPDISQLYRSPGDKSADSGRQNNVPGRARTSDVGYKEHFCLNLNCDEKDKKTVCGMKKEEKGVNLRIFDNQCLLMKYGCTVVLGDEFGLTDLTLCQRAFPNYFKNRNDEEITAIESDESTKDDDIVAESCMEYCADLTDVKLACGISKNKTSFKVRLFLTRCEMLKYNCVKKATFVQTELVNCDGLDVAVLDEEGDNRIDKEDKNIVTEVTGNLEDDKDPLSSILEEDTNNSIVTIEKYQEVYPPEPVEQMTKEIDTDARRKVSEKKYKKNIIVIDRSILDLNGDINESIDSFFKSTHKTGLNLQDLSKELEMKDTRRMHIPVVAPIKVYKPWVTIPKNQKNLSEKDPWQWPTLDTCYHRCPKICPDTYKPVCGNPGTIAREPSLVFLNHCFMDVAQCKMKWDDASSTSKSSAYIENSFVFCLGDVLSDYLRFLPVVRTLQHMGRLKKKALFKYKIRNMKFYNNFLLREPKPMG